MKLEPLDLPDGWMEAPGYADDTTVAAAYTKGRGQFSIEVVECGPDKSSSDDDAALRVALRENDRPQGPVTLTERYAPSYKEASALVRELAELDIADTFGKRSTFFLDRDIDQAIRLYCARTGRSEPDVIREIVRLGLQTTEDP